MAVDDLKLWSDFVKGDNVAYALMYDKHVQSLYSYGMCFTKNNALVEDCIHDLFVKLFQNRHNLNKVSNIRLYLLKALKNLLYDALSKDSNRTSLENEEPVFAVEYTVEDEIIEREGETSVKKMCREMLKTLSLKQKEIIYYRFEQGLSYEEIGELVGMNAQSVQNTMQRAFKKLRENFSIGEIMLLLLYLYFG